jgi:hypothetical protein
MTIDIDAIRPRLPAFRLAASKILAEIDAREERMKADCMESLREYDRIAGYRGWLPLRLSHDDQPHPQTILVAANRCKALYPELAGHLREAAAKLEAVHG